MSTGKLPSAGRARDAWRVVQRDGTRGLAQRVARVAYRRLGAASLEFPLHLEDVADSRGLSLAQPHRRPAPGTPLTIGWICTPPGPGSGGHTTLFRMVEAAEAAGHTCVLYLYDRYGGDLAHHEQVIREFWPGMRAEVRSVADGMVDLDAYVASAWSTAHVLASRADLRTRRLYFIQDYEPFFYPQGSEYHLAADTYRFGFRAITVGPMIAQILRDEYHVEAAVAEFGVDTAVYRLTNPNPRRGVIFYSRPEVARRGFEIGMLALREFHHRHPEHDIHLFGDPGVTVPFPATNHGKVTPARLAELYNECVAGIAISFTNVSLVPDELLACGAIPVTCESEYARASLDNPFVRWAAPTPYALAESLSDVVSGNAAPPSVVAGSIRDVRWDTAQRTTVRTIEDEVYGP
ncbi:glycosyltransferase family 1 protein [Luedemannella flava]|uniref:Glycosyltransferase family 1 protein n=1 Tax=Luedemannella flava TaxID=349316 RepID=A0ABP4Y8H6_9ACTN